MKGAFFAFIFGILIGAGGYWLLTDRNAENDLETAKQNIETGAEKVSQSVKSAVDEIDTEKIKEELSETGMVIREKAKRAGEVIADATANARTTGSIKAKLIAEPGLSGLSINVDTTSGLVTLSGTVESPEQVARAVKIALDTEGVHKVVSTLQVKPKK